jgi:general stress protein 26
MEMAENGRPHDADADVPTDKKLEDLYKLIEGIEVAMFTTRRPDGHLVSRPMQAQEKNPVADLWFVTDGDSHKLDELEHDAHVNLSFYRDRTREWISVSGTARVSRDRAKIHELYKPDWRAWFADEGGERNGGPDDPRLTLVLVEAHTVVYMKSDTPRPVVLFEVMKGIITGQKPNVGSVRTLDEGELHGGRAAQA